MRRSRHDVKNIILFLGDGMGIAHRTAARIVKYGVTAGQPDGFLEMDRFPGVGLVTTHSLNSIVTDSAPGMSSYTTGNHTKNGQEGVYPAHMVSPFLYPRVEYLAEYLHRTEDGSLAFDTTASNAISDYRNSQDGWCVQSVYLFQPRWRVGLRYDSMDSGNPRIGLVDTGLLPRTAFPALLSGSPDRVTLMLDWSPSEFSRLRAQYDWDDARDDGDTDRIVRLQYIYGIGAHGAHKY